jgi:hypothetical protein
VDSGHRGINDTAHRDEETATACMKRNGTSIVQRRSAAHTHRVACCRLTIAKSQANAGGI